MMSRSAFGALVVASAAFLATACTGVATLPAAPTAGDGGCAVTLDPPAQHTPADGGSFHTAVTGLCGWSAESETSWITVRHGSGAGAGSVVYAVQENAGTLPRVGSIRIGDQRFFVSQAEAACTFQLSPTGLGFSTEGGTSELRLATQPHCEWSVIATESWVSVTGASGRGPGIALVSVPVNAGGGRSALLIVAGRAIVVQQDAYIPPPPPPDPEPPPPPPPSEPYYPYGAG